MDTQLVQVTVVKKVAFTRVAQRQCKPIMNVVMFEKVIIIYPITLDTYH